MAEREVSTTRLSLLPVSSDIKNAIRTSPKAFAATLGVALPEGWPQFPEAFMSARHEPPDPWTGYLFLARQGPMLVGNGGFVSEPDASGTVEIGYEIAPALWNCGYATEAAAALVSRAFEAGANSVIAHSLAETNASNAVMRKIGMQFSGAIETPGQEAWRWRIERERHT